MKYSELKMMEIEKNYNLKYGFEAAVSKLAQRKSGRFSVSGSPGIGKTTRFPHELSMQTGKTVLVVLPNTLTATAAYDSAVALNYGSPSLCLGGFKPLNINGHGNVVYITAAYFCVLTLSGKFDDELIVVIDESTTDTLEVKSCCRAGSMMAAYNLVIEMATQIGVEVEPLKPNVTVTVLNGDAQELRAAVKGRSVIRYFPDALSCRETALKDGVVPLTGGSGRDEYEAAKNAISRKGTVYAAAEVGSSINLRPEVVISVSRKVALVEKEDEVVAALVPTTRWEKWNMGGRVGRNGEPGEIITDQKILMTKNEAKAESSKIEEEMCRLLFRHVCGLEPNNSLQRKLLKAIGSVPDFLQLVLTNPEWRIDKFGVRDKDVKANVRSEFDKSDLKYTLPNRDKPPSYALTVRREPDKETFNMKFWTGSLVSLRRTEPEIEDYYAEMELLFGDNQRYGLLMISKLQQELVHKRILASRNYLVVMANRRRRTLNKDNPFIDEPDIYDKLIKLSLFYDKLSVMYVTKELSYRAGEHTLTLLSERLYPRLSDVGNIGMLCPDSFT